MNPSSHPEGTAGGAAAGPPTDTAPHLLVVDDDQRIRTLLSRYLGEHGYRVSVAADAAVARQRLEGLAFDLLIVDIMMPGESGLELTQSLRRTSDVPILLLTALSETEHRIGGLQLGADDYLAKPFDPRELLLRINNILRRGQPAEAPLFEQIRFGPFTFHIERMELRRGTEPVRLTDRERRMLRLLATSQGQTVSRADLRGGADANGERTVDVQINRLRRKIEPDPANPTYLQTVRGVGYRLATEA